ncbi:MAG TPA: hypothetical protein VMR25_26775 [Planctomycetaceae bacterium]|jgi:hypothetical protein|nr:hypothetical protein [Planctomycetaceae bacterium]
MTVTDLLFGKSLASDEEGEHRVGVLEGIPIEAKVPGTDSPTRFLAP